MVREEERTHVKIKRTKYGDEMIEKCRFFSIFSFALDCRFNFNYKNFWWVLLKNEFKPFGFLKRFKVKRSKFLIMALQETSKFIWNL